MSDSINRRTILQTLAVGLALVPQSGAAGIPDEVVPKEKARLTRDSFGDLRVFLDGNTEQLRGLAVGSIELKPGQSPHPAHAHPEEELMLITEGHGEISLGDQVSKAGPGALMYCGANRRHGIVNTSSAPLTFYYIKWTAK